jgi:hypothetical protein
MNTVPNTQTCKISRAPRRAFPTAATLLLLVLALLMSLGPASRPAQAICEEPPCINLPPYVSADNPSVVVNEGQTATNTGTFEDPEEDGVLDTVSSITASEGTVTKSGTRFGTWSWSMATAEVCADETKTVTITAKDSEGASSTTSFTLTVKDVPESPPVQNGRIAYQRSDGNDSEIYTIDPCGGTPSKVTNNTRDDGGPSYSPFGTRIAYEGYDGPVSIGDIYTISATGGTPFKVTNNPEHDSNPSWGIDPPPDTQAPRVSSTSPTANATGVAPSANLTATFSETMDRTSVTTSTFKLFKVSSTGTTQITNVSVSSDGLKARLNPFGSSTTLLSRGTKYKAMVTTGAKDVADNPLDQNTTKDGLQQKAWSFTVRN